MSSRTRVVLNWRGEWYAGRRAKAQLELLHRDYIGAISFPKQVSWKECIGTFKTMNAGRGDGCLWVIREPRRSREEKSRYKQICAYYGLNGKIGKKLKMPGLWADATLRTLEAQLDLGGVGVIPRTATARIVGTNPFRVRRAEEQGQVPAPPGQIVEMNNPLGMAGQAQAYGFDVEYAAMPRMYNYQDMHGNQQIGFQVPQAAAQAPPPPVRPMYADLQEENFDDMDRMERADDDGNF